MENNFKDIFTEFIHVHPFHCLQSHRNTWSCRDCILHLHTPNPNIYIFFKSSKDTYVHPDIQKTILCLIFWANITIWNLKIKQSSHLLKIYKYQTCIKFEPHYLFFFKLSLYFKRHVSKLKLIKSLGTFKDIKVIDSISLQYENCLFTSLSNIFKTIF